MHPALIVQQVFDWVLALATHRKLVADARRLLARPRSFVPDISPDAGGFSLLIAGSQHLERGIVGEQGDTILGALCNGLSQRCQQGGRFAYQNMRKQTRLGATPFNRARGHWGLGYCLTVAASHTGTNNLVHDKEIGDVFQLFGDIFAQL